MTAAEIIEKARREERHTLTELESKELLASLGIRTPQMRPAAGREEAVAASRAIPPARRAAPGRRRRAVPGPAA